VSTRLILNRLYGVRKLACAIWEKALTAGRAEASFSTPKIRQEHDTMYLDLYFSGMSIFAFSYIREV
jgi:hypothetical protein